MLVSQAGFLEALGQHETRSWFCRNHGLANSADELFEAADALADRLRPYAKTDPVARWGDGKLIGAMTLIVRRVLALVADEELLRTASPLVVTSTARRASERLRQWCPASLADKPTMLSVVAYAVVEAATALTKRLPARGDLKAKQRQIDQVGAEVAAAATEVVATIEQLLSEYRPPKWFDTPLDTSTPGEASRLMRSLHGAAWLYDRVGQAGVKLPVAPLLKLRQHVRTLWPHACDHEAEARCAIAAIAHLSSAWASAIEQGAGLDRRIPLEALWLARQAAGRYRNNEAINNQLIQLSQATAAVAGVALVRCPRMRDVQIGQRAARLLREVVSSGTTECLLPNLVTALKNAAYVAAFAADTAMGGHHEIYGDIVAVATAIKQRGRKGSGDPQHRAALQPAFDELANVLNEARDRLACTSR